MQRKILPSPGLVIEFSPEQDKEKSLSSIYYIDFLGKCNIVFQQKTNFSGQKSKLLRFMVFSYAQYFQNLPGRVFHQPYPGPPESKGDPFLLLF